MNISGTFVELTSGQATAFLQTDNEIRQTIFGDDYQVQSRPKTLVPVTTSLHLLNINHLVGITLFLFCMC